MTIKMAYVKVDSRLLVCSASIFIFLGIGWFICYHSSRQEMKYFRHAKIDNDDMHILNDDANVISRDTDEVHRDSFVINHDVDIRITVITIDRSNSLQKTLDSLDKLLLDGDRAVLEIWIDVDRNGSFDAATELVARSFRWRKGPSRVRVQSRSVGIYGQWIDTWKPRPGSLEIGLIVEDDVDVSPMAYRWLKAVHGKMANRTDFAGVTLSSDQSKTLSTQAKRQFAAPETDTIFMYKCLGTYGFSPNLEHWRRFQDWFHLHKPSVLPGFRPLVPDSLPSKWYATFEKRGTTHNMWSMWFIYYMHIEQLYVVYNNLRVYTGNKNSCLSAHRAEIGLHSKVRVRDANYCTLLTVWRDDFVTFPKDIIRLHWDGTPMGSRYYFL